MEHSAASSDHSGGLKFRSEAWNSLNQVSLINFLNHDTRPTFILDLHHADEHDPPIIPVFMNPALCKSHALYAVIGRTSEHQSTTNDEFDHLQAFLTWARTPSKGASALSFHFADYSWISTTLDDRWRIIVAATSVRTSQEQADPPPLLLSVPDPASSHPSRGPPFTVNEDQRGHLAARDFFLDSSLELNLQRPSEAPPQLSTSSLAEAHSISSTGRAPDLAPDDRDARVAKRNADLLTKIAAFDNVAIFFADVNGEIIFCNDAWYDMNQHPRHQTNAMSWTNVVEDDEVPRMMSLWTRVLVHQESIRYEARIKRRWIPSTAFPDAPSDFPTWLSGYAYPDVSFDGRTVGVCGVMTDISEQKWTEHRMKQDLSHAIERASLLEQLSLRAKEVTDTETRFRRLSDMMPSAIWMSNEVGKIIYANDAYRDLVPGASESPEPWWDMIPDEQIPKAREYYRLLMEDHVKVTFEIAFRKFPKSSVVPSDEYKWILVSAYPELHEDGRVKYITGCMVDVNDLKLAEQIQATRVSDALESTRQLEQFIDMTSHEMRNPLSAIVHSAEEILSTLRDSDPQGLTKAAVLDAVEAAEIIIYCADHSTRIVDDILLVSKLESGLLTITPTVVQPLDAVRRALKMFEGEMRAANISPSFTSDDSFDLLHVDWVKLDMSRVLQIFVNLITNAIKFTRPESVRQINVSMKASLQRPTDTALGNEFYYLEPQAASEVTDNESEIVYLTTTVQDTGCGLTEAEQKNLFLRFSQAGKRTHVQYGGTGLGLFISRQLCEMQGGQIGVQSVPSQGSTFSFYVKAYRTVPPESVSTESLLTQHEQNPETATELEKNTEEEKKRAQGDKSAVTPPPQVNGGVGSDKSRENAFVPSPSKSTVLPPASVLARRNTDKISDNPQQSTILLVEDNLVNQKVVAKKLRTQGYKVLLANHGLEALDQISKSALWSGTTATPTPISLILLDMEMPVMDGLTCIRRIRESEKSGEIRCHIPVIAVTANARQEQINQAKGAGMDDVVTKPFRMDQLFTTMTRLMEEFSTAD